MLLAVAFSAMLAVLVVVLVMQYLRGRNPKPLDPSKAAQYVQGTLTVTGVSERPDEGDKNGERYCTLSGTIVGPATQPAEIYGTFTFGAMDPWPQIGHEMPVLYKPGKASTTWRIGELPPPPPMGEQPGGPIA